jgi:hypothetical protein
MSRATVCTVLATALVSLGSAYPAFASSANAFSLAPFANDASFIQLGGFLKLLGGFFGVSATSAAETPGGGGGGSAPNISDVESTTLDNSATTTWTTDIPSTSEVVYGLSTSLGSSTSDASDVTSHTLLLNNLASSTLYYYEVVSSNGSNTSTSSLETFETSSTGLPLNAEGWTVFTPTLGTGSCSAGTYTGTCIVYVSSSQGNDSTCEPVAPPVNESGVTPCATLLHAETLIRNGYPDWMLLKRGDTWVGQSFSDISNKLNGPSPQEPILISSYGTSGASPLIEVSSSPDVNGLAEGFGTCCHEGGNNSAWVGLDFYAYQRDPSNPNFAPSSLEASNEGGFDIVEPITWLLIEGDTFNFFQNDVIEGSPLGEQSNVTLRRDVIENDYSGSEAHSQGLFTADVANLTVEDNVFDHNGWNGTLTTPGVVTISIGSPATVTWSGNNLSDNSQIEFTSTGTLPTGLASSTDYCVMNLSGSTFNVYDDGGNCAGDDPTAIDTSGSQSGTQYGIWEDPAPTIFNRNNYIDLGDGNTIFNDNIDAEGSSGGVQMREGGYTENNLFLQDPIAITYGHQQNAEQNVPGTISDNVILDSEDIGTPADPGYQPQGTGIDLSTNGYLSGLGGPSYIDNLNVYDNIVAHDVHGSVNIGGIDFGSTEEAPFINTDVYDNIVYDWSNPGGDDLQFSVPASSTDTYFQNNTIQEPNGGGVGFFDGVSGGLTLSNNTYYSASTTSEWFSNNGAYISPSTWQSETGDSNDTFASQGYVNPNCTIGTYDSSVLGGPGTFADFIAQADQQNYEDWNPNLTPEVANQYFRNCYTPN